MNELRWEIYVPIWRNRFILQGLWLALGIPFGTLIALIIILAGGDVMGTDAKYALFMIVLLFVLTYLLTLILYGGKYAPGFIVDKNGATNYTQAAQTKKNRVMNTILIVLGLFKGNFTAMGAGVLAQSRQVVRVKWKNVRWVKYYPREHTILLQGGFAEKIAIFCTCENYGLAEKMVKEYLRDFGKGAVEKTGRA
jgi:hypothetical protein